MNKGKKFRLTPLQRRFCEGYLVSFNATQAYIDASTTKVSRRAAASCGHKLLRIPELAEYLSKRSVWVTAEAGVTVQETLKKLRQVTMYDVRQLFDDAGRPKTIRNLDDDTAMAIVGIKVVTTGNALLGLGEVTEYKLADRLSGIDKAMRYHGLFGKDNKQLTDPLTELIAEIAARGSRVVPKAQ